MNDPIKSDRLATVLGAVLGVCGFCVTTIAMFAPVHDSVKETAIATIGVIATGSSIGISRSNKVLRGTDDDGNGQP